MKLDEASKQWHGDGGFELSILQSLKTYYNFNIELINCNSVWGSKLANGSWSGIIGQLKSNVCITLSIIGVCLLTPNDQCRKLTWESEV